MLPLLCLQPKFRIEAEHRETHRLEIRKEEEEEEEEGQREGGSTDLTHGRAAVIQAPEQTASLLELGVALVAHLYGFAGRALSGRA